MNRQTGRLADWREGRRAEFGWLIAELVALLLVFLVAFTGRDTFGDGVKALLTGLSVVVGALGAGAGLVVIARGLARRSTAIWRVPLGGLMAFLGLYTIVHVLS